MHYTNVILLPMSVVVVVLLVVLWAWILLPGAVRERRETSPVTSVSRFERSMAHLARANPVRSRRDGPAQPGPGHRIFVLDRPEAVVHGDASGRAARRRRQVLTVLTASNTLALIAVRTIGGFTWVVFWLLAALLATYLMLLGHRWVRTSRDAALPLVRPPAFDREALVARTERWRAPSPPSREATDVGFDGDAVRVVDW